MQALINIARNAIRRPKRISEGVVNSETPYRVSAKINLQKQKITAYIDELVAENIDFRQIIWI